MAITGLTTTASVSIDEDAFNRLMFFALRSELYFDAVADVKPTAQSMPGKTVTFPIAADLAPATAALNESTDIDAVALSDSTVFVTLVEQGNTTVTSAKLRGTAYVPVDPVQANIVGYNAGDSLDLIARAFLQAGDNVTYAGNATARNTVGPDDTLDHDDVRRALALLRGSNVPTIGGDYVAFVHPDQSYDFRGISNVTAGWADPVAYSAPERRWAGEIGKFENFRFIETPRAPVFADAGSSTTLTDVYAALFVGRQSLAKAWSYTDGNTEYPVVVPGPVTDHLRRFVYLGWYWLGGYKRFREASLRRVESSSTIGANAA